MKAEPMNAPHVVALQYRIEYRADVINWSRAVPLKKEEADFYVQVKDGWVHFVFKQTYASEKEARSVTETVYIPNWEFAVGLSRGPGAFALRFFLAKYSDRFRVEFRAGIPSVRVNLAPPKPTCFPEPPSAGIKRSWEVDNMYKHYLKFLEGKESLSTMAYFCLTSLEEIAGNRDSAAVQFGISKRVFKRIGDLSSNKGGDGARKAAGQRAPYTGEEERFLKSAAGKLIYRVAEVEYGHHPSRKKITLADI
ncbi:MAG: hypothetical protein OXF74_13815 [Rhodobacteraceae bacterium]|nr:hypothetical protein [Paracoccaceae bacterium]